ncbi:MAG: M4 family metallopeptidase [Planctomycetia bacterium]|nr:M4 family metallopeptidase [Planctomycetia bacterium]
MCNRNPIECFVPPYITERLAESPDPEIRRRAIANLASAAAVRAVREISQAMPTLMASMSPSREKHRLVYDAGGTDVLPGKLVRSEGQAKTADRAANEAYAFSGDTYNYFAKVFQRSSLDDKGMSLISSVHAAEADGTALDNAFWNGSQMAYGDGDGTVFRRFTRSLEVVGHELTHGVESFTSNLAYHGQSGALNEHFADVFGILIRQWKRGEKAATASWVIGAAVLVPAPTRRGIRDMEEPGTAFTNDPHLGTDPQPAHISKIYSGSRDRGGVHINSGIPNRAFALAAKSLKGKAWDVAGRIWYNAMLALNEASQFLDCAKATVEAARTHGPAAKKAVAAAWKKVGITV